MNTIITSPPSREDQWLIESITYLASLASEPKVIDPLLDNLRLITSGVRPDQSIGRTEADQLRQVKAKLVDYLLHYDPVREFTQEELDSLLADRVGTATRAPLERSTLKYAGVIVVLMVTNYILGGLLLSAFGINYAWLLAGMVGMVTMYIGLIWLYWSSLKTFTPKLQQAYFWVVLGIGLMGVVAPLEGAFVMFPGLIEGTVLSYAQGFGLFSLSFLFVYYGLRMFALTLGVKTRLTSLQLTLAGILLAVLTAHFIPMHAGADPVALSLGISSVLSMACFGLLAGGLAYKIAPSLTPMYRRAVRVLGAGYLLAGLVMVGATLSLILAGPLTGGRMLITVLPSMVAGVLVFISGYYFKRSSGKS